MQTTKSLPALAVFAHSSLTFDLVTCCDQTHKKNGPVHGLAILLVLISGDLLQLPNCRTVATLTQAGKLLPCYSSRRVSIDRPSPPVLHQHRTVGAVPMHNFHQRQRPIKLGIAVARSCLSRKKAIRFFMGKNSRLGQHSIPPPPLLQTDRQTDRELSLIHI